MREIKFRGKGINKENTIHLEHNWEFGSLVIANVTKKHFIVDFDYLDNIETPFYYGAFEVIPETVGQFTGLKDKNGKEIYEDDIVLTNEGKWIARVVYNRDKFICIDNYGGFSSYCDWEEFEVIGNVYDNPSLLERIIKEGDV